MKFTIDDKLATQNEKSATVTKAESLLRSLPDGKLITALRLTELARLRFSTFCNQRGFLSKEMCVRSGSKNLYGNPKTIKAFKAANHI